MTETAHIILEVALGRALEREDKLKAENKRLRSFLQDALPHIECMTNSQSSLITAIGEYLQTLKGTQ
ncbi:hypothetical protein LCGC14_2191760 [marine sediment metagenome]|uniref:Uncharacterized protein n=1 Tax=marine sediment metagenome TaxID=412755 RepID=A0A0F9DJE3_9ZZZZ